jgi:hypothetical protein
LFSSVTGAEFHEATYRHIAQSLRGCTTRSVISIMDVYRKTQKRLQSLEEQGIELLDCEGQAFDDLMHALVRISSENGMEIVSCAEKIDLQPYGIRPGKCVDDEYIAKVFGINVTDKKDPSQRKACGCVVSKDIGMYDSCLYGCPYCYATSSFEQAQANYAAHDPSSPSLIGWYDAQVE